MAHWTATVNAPTPITVKANSARGIVGELGYNTKALAAADTITITSPSGRSAECRIDWEAGTLRGIGATATDGTGIVANWRTIQAFDRLDAAIIRARKLRPAPVAIEEPAPAQEEPAPVAEAFAAFVSNLPGARRYASERNLATRKFAAFLIEKGHYEDAFARIRDGYGTGSAVAYVELLKAYGMTPRW